MDGVKGLGKFCSASKDCEVDRPCDHCLKLDRVFTPEQEKEIQKFLDENKDLMDDLVKLGD